MDARQINISGGWKIQVVRYSTVLTFYTRGCEIATCLLSVLRVGKYCDQGFWDYKARSLACDALRVLPCSCPVDFLTSPLSAMCAGANSAPSITTRACSWHRVSPNILRGQLSEQEQICLCRLKNDPDYLDCRMPAQKVEIVQRREPLL